MTKKAKKKGETWPPRRAYTPHALLEISLHRACELITAHTGTEVTPATHWVRAVCEMTRDAQPYALVRLEAFRRAGADVRAAGDEAIQSETE